MLGRWGFPYGQIVENGTEPISNLMTELKNDLIEMGYISLTISSDGSNPPELACSKYNSQLLCYPSIVSRAN
jgi:hypothetical protein